MNTNTKKTLSVAVSVFLLFVIFASLFFVVEEADHHCTGEDCPICANIHQAEQTLRNSANCTISSTSVNAVPVLCVVMTVCQYFLATGTSLVSQKVRLNN